MASEQPIPGRCGALIRKWEKKFGHKMYCTSPAGLGTDHKGTGKCKMHGGASTGPNGATRTLKAAKKEIVKAILHGDVPGYQDFKDLQPHIKYDLDLELYAGKSVVEKAIVDLLKEKNIDGESGDEIKATLIKLLINVGEFNRRNIETQYKIKYADVSKFQVQFVHKFIEILLIKAYSDVGLGFSFDQKRRFRELIVEALRECSEQGRGESPSPESATYHEVNENMENRTS